MEIRQVSSLSQTTGVILWPLFKNSALASNLLALAKLLQVDPERLSEDFKADFKETISLPYKKGGQNLYLLGLGEKSESTEIMAAFRACGFQKRKLMGRQISIVFNGLPATIKHSTFADWAVTGFRLGLYQLEHHKLESKPAPVTLLAPDSVLHLVSRQRGVAEAAQKALTVSETQFRIMDLVNAPANFKTPQHIVNFVTDSSRLYGYKMEAVVGRPALVARGLHALNSVSLGSPNDPAFLILQYSPTHLPDAPHIGLVGKGVTFDTGGVSLKDSSGLYNMKSDMAGAAAVIGAIETAARLQLPIRITATLPITENSIDAASIRPSDVISSYSGRSIEIIDTDAEGRLILADGLSYLIRNFKPEVVLDLATLTGSVIRTLGYHAAGLFTENEALAEMLYTTGLASGERLWRLPLWDAYSDEVQSEIADVRNLGSKPMAGATTAAKFLEVFTDKHPCWAHLDIAGTAFGNMEYASTQKVATGYGVRLLLHIMERIIAQPDRFAIRN